MVELCLKELIPIRLIVNADDFGYSKGVNFGIIEAYTEGVVTSATMMCNMPSAQHAFALMQEYRELPVGIHLVLDSGRPLHDHVPSLVDEQGNFLHLPELVMSATADDIERELSAQIEYFLSFGVRPTHIDSHHHVHAHERILPVVLKLAQHYQLPLRRYAVMQEEWVRSPDTLIHEFYGDRLSSELFLRLLEQGEGYDTVEIMTHPAYLDPELQRRSSYYAARVQELAILTDPWLRTELGQRGIQLISYREIG